MRHFISGLALIVTVAAGALLARPAHAQGATLDNTQWTDPSGSYLVSLGQGLEINPPPGGGGGVWLEYQANVTYRDGSPLMTTDADGNPLPITYKITAQLHGNAGDGFQVEFTYDIQAGGLEDTGGGHMVLSGDQQTLSGSYTDNIDGSTGSMVLVRIPPSQ